MEVSREEIDALRAEVAHWAAEASAFDGQRRVAESSLAEVFARLQRVREMCLTVNVHGELEPTNGFCAAIIRATYPGSGRR